MGHEHPEKILIIHETGRAGEVMDFVQLLSKKKGSTKRVDPGNPFLSIRS